MSYQDFIANFDEVQFCHLQPDAVAQDLAKATVSHVICIQKEECFSMGLSAIYDWHVLVKFTRYFSVNVYTRLSECKHVFCCITYTISEYDKEMP